MADTDTTLPIGIELPVRLVIGDGVIDVEVGTVTLDPGDTPDKVISEFLFNVAEEINRQSDMAKQAILDGLMTRVEVPRGQEPDPRYMPGTDIERGTPEALALLLGNAEDVNRGGDTRSTCGADWCACHPTT